MKSRLTIEVDFENGNQPVIQILKSSSPDVRDQLVAAFCQQLGGSSWCQIKWVANATEDPDSKDRIHISPIKPEDLQKQANIMYDQYKLNQQHLASNQN